MARRKHLPKNWPSDRPIPKYCSWRDNVWVVTAPFARTPHYIGSWSFEDTEIAFECATKINKALDHLPNHPVVWNLLVDISREYDRNIGFHTYPDGSHELDYLLEEEV